MRSTQREPTQPMHTVTWVGIVLLVAAGAIRVLVPFPFGVDLPSSDKVVSVNLILFWALVAAGAGALLWDLSGRISLAGALAVFVEDAL
jgi:hypothetical protein